MLCRAIDHGRGRRRGEAKLLRRPPARAASRLLGVLRRAWRRATARKPLAQACEAQTGGPDDDLLDEMAVW